LFNKAATIRNVRHLDIYTSKHNSIKCVSKRGKQEAQLSQRIEGTALCAMSVEFLSIAAKTHEKSHLKM